MQNTLVKICPSKWFSLCCGAKRVGSPGKEAKRLMTKERRITRMYKSATKPKFNLFVWPPAPGGRNWKAGRSSAHSHRPRTSERESLLYVSCGFHCRLWTPHISRQWKWNACRPAEYSGGVEYIHKEPPPPRARSSLLFSLCSRCESERAPSPQRWRRGTHGERARAFFFTRPIRPYLFYLHAIAVIAGDVDDLISSHPPPQARTDHQDTNKRG